MESDVNGLFVDEDHAQQSKSVRGTNPWVLKCHQKQLSQLRRSQTHPQQKEKDPQCQSKDKK